MNAMGIVETVVLLVFCGVICFIVGWNLGRDAVLRKMNNREYELKARTAELDELTQSGWLDVLEPYLGGRTPDKVGERVHKAFEVASSTYGQMTIINGSGRAIGESWWKFTQTDWTAIGELLISLEEDAFLLTSPKRTRPGA
jgi:hypothetical protein